MTPATTTNRLSTTLLKHLTKETELHIVNGQLTSVSASTLQLLVSDQYLMQYKARLSDIMNPWFLNLGGQPNNPKVEETLLNRVYQIVQHFKSVIYKIQDLANEMM